VNTSSIGSGITVGSLTLIERVGCKNIGIYLEVTIIIRIFVLLNN
jgi:hypothetical protein